MALVTALLLLMAIVASAQQPSANPQSETRLGGGGIPNPQPSPTARQKLVMKDGSYQFVRGYQVVGDRVRYYSIERDEWEEVPASLVDWKATEATNRNEETEALGRAQQAGKEYSESQADPHQFLGPEIAPGVFIPDEDGIYILKAGKAVALPRQEARARVDKGRVAINVLLPVPLLKNRNLVEIPGARAQLRLDASPAAFYAHGRARDDSRYVVVRLKPKGDVRQVEAILTNILGRNPTHSGEYVELKSETVVPNVFKLTPAQPLGAGEYAVIEFLGKDLNLYLWDFGIDGGTEPKR
jgi:hypothetical protein